MPSPQDTAAASSDSTDFDPAVHIYNLNGAEAEKALGNTAYAADDLPKALQHYTKALTLVHPGSREAATYLKNRAAVYVKQSLFKKVVDDCNAALAIIQNDIKALYRRGQAYEKLDAIDLAFKDMRTIVLLDATNKEAAAAAHRLGKLNSERADLLNSTDGVIREMLKIVTSDAKADKKIHAMNNLGILAQQPGKAEQLVAQHAIEELAKYLQSTDDTIATAAIRALCSISHHKTYLAKVVEVAGLDTLTYLVGSQSVEVSRYAIQLLSTSLAKETEIEKEEKARELQATQDKERREQQLKEEPSKIVEIDPSAPETTPAAPSPASATPVATPLPEHILDSNELTHALDALIKTIQSTTIESKVKFAAFNAIMRVVSTQDAALRFVARRGLSAVLANGALGDVFFQVPAKAPIKADGDMDDEDEDEASRARAKAAAAKKASSEPPQPPSNLRTHVALVLARVHDVLGPKQEDTFKNVCLEAVLPLVNSEEEEDNVKGLYTISTILQANPDVGNWLIGCEGMLNKVIELADTQHEGLMVASAEVIALAASDKKRCQAIFADGFDQLKALYKSGKDRVRARALVGLCKVGTVSEGAPNQRILAEGSTVNLEKAARRYLVGASLRAIEGPAGAKDAPAHQTDSRYDSELRKWAVEGLAYLTLDADVKEALIEDVAALKALFAMAIKEEDKAVRYGIATILVNLSNSQEKPERMPELDQLKKFAGEKVPVPHPKDADEFIAPRVKRLVDVGVIPALVSISHQSESAIANELLARVFLTVATDTANRGLIVRQGGVKALMGLANKGTPKGVNIAAQALAKVAITMDPNIAFAGQKAAELVRPLLRLCQSESGLQNYEALLALTNLASVGDELRQRIVLEKGMHQIESLQFEENVNLQRAATECLCNLLMFSDVADMFIKESGRCYEKLHLWVLFSGSEDVGLSRAASGGLAMLSDDAGVCKRIAEDKNGFEILKELAISKETDLQMRAFHILRNMINSSKAISETFIDKEQGLDIVWAVDGTTKSPVIKKLAGEIVQQLMKYELIDVVKP
ncbi:hypothetical protein CAOG_08729 [Capsaspora owczarzaki ATCC 30864]|uniref:Protein unc-45 homolog B n=1 Tax=Capsaspora owczarzaki (strain ATCC 30864) TaxID=595528 RepID=A0A0D2UCG5_CAPO3|nr:hypothetical protein CAOG_08729 [Capsaspora owczarzaki ATCC 30864]KJE92716.1 hypothetical protein CAOG_008729 [Capsaspora owczarzaki ATCC 30864]|eukprot:XP_011270349.1 hypothetical protein CAOG_08729 [Capsaspora owczarzaki ATCC 30864]